MALKPGRVEDPYAQHISFSMAVTGERGGVVCFVTAGSGEAMDIGTVAYNTGVGKPVGVLLNDMISIDQSKNPRHYFKDEMPIPGKTTLLRRGWVVTNAVSGSPNGGDTAYLANNGLIAPTGSVVVGQFLSAKDEDGFAKVAINI
jgi:hypothetical protein